MVVGDVVYRAFISIFASSRLVKWPLCIESECVCGVRDVTELTNVSVDTIKFRWAKPGVKG